MLRRINTYRLIAAFLVAWLALGQMLVMPAEAQKETWDYKVREKSQQYTSAGVDQLTKGQTDHAITLLISATHVDPTDPLPYGMLGLALDMKGRYPEGLDALLKSYQMAPTVAETVLSIGVTRYLMHDYDKAINAWRKVLEINPNLCHIHANIGFAYMRKGDLARATDSFRQMINCHPNSQVAYQGIATVKYLAGDFAGARQAAEQAQSIFAYPPVLLLLAKLDFLQGDRQRGQRRVQEYLSLTRKPWLERPMTAIGYAAQHDFHWDPLLSDNFDNAYLVWARSLDLPREASRQASLARQGKASELIDKARAALSAVPNDYSLLRELGLVQLGSGQYSDAAEQFKRVLTVCPQMNVDRLHLGQALALDGKAAEASAYVRQFQRKFPAEQLSPTLREIARVDPGLSGPAEGSSAPLEGIETAEPGFSTPRKSTDPSF